MPSDALISSLDSFILSLPEELIVECLFSGETGDWRVSAFVGDDVNDSQNIGTKSRLKCSGKLIRALYPDETVFTFWDYFRNAWARNAGLRIDHLLLSPAAAQRLVAAGVDREVRGREKASDHAPVWIELAAEGKGRGRATGRRRSPKGRAGRRTAAA